MKRWVLILCLLAGCATAPPVGGIKGDDYNPVYPLPMPGASFMTNLLNFAKGEVPAERTEYGFSNFVVSGCIGPTSAGLTHTPTSCIAYNANIRGTEVQSITYPDNKSIIWVAMDENTTGANAGLPHFGRVAGTHYLIDSQDAGQPSMAADSQLLMKVTTAAGAITTVVDLRQVGGYFTGKTNQFPINQLPSQTGDYSANSHKITNLAQASNTGDALGWGQNATVANLTATGATTVTSLTGTCSILNNTLNVMCPPYNAKCDGTTDDTAAIQSASTFAFANAQRLFIPAVCRVTQLNWTNHQNGQVNVAGNGPAISKILCREPVFDTGVCVDMTDTERAALNGFSISSSGADVPASCGNTATCAPKISLLISETLFAPGSNSQNYDFDFVNIDNYGSGASSAGDYGLYSYGGEIFDATHYYFGGGAVAAAFFTVANVPGISSPWRGALATGPTSMTTVRLAHGRIDANGLSAWPVIMESPGGDEMGDFSIRDTYINSPGPGAIEGIGTGLIHGLKLDTIRYEPQGGSSVVFAQFAPQVENFDFNNLIYAGVAPIVSIIQFNKSGGPISAAGGHINIRSSDSQGNYGTASVVSCTDGAAGVQFDSVDFAGGGPAPLSACKGISLHYNATFYDPFLYNGNGASAIPACNSITINDSRKIVNDGVTNCTSLAIYTAGAGAATCHVGCDGTNWRYIF